MTKEQFNRWRDDMREKHPGLTDTKCAKMLGVSRRTFIRYKEIGAGLTTALACNSLLQNLGPYK